MMIDAAECLTDLRIPPANKLESLSGDRKGQWRICFTPVEGGRKFRDVEIVDYH